MTAVWVTRSEPGATRQARALETAGYHVLKVPVLVISPLEAEAPAGPFDLVIVLSEHGVHHAPAAVWSVGQRILAIGRRTAAVLGELGVEAETPGLATAEGLLAGPLAEPAPAGQRILLVRGKGGRELLPDTLRARGARLTELIVYERVTAATDRERFLNLAAATIAPEPGKIGAIVAASGDGLDSIAAWLPAFREVPLLAPSARVAARARALGFEPVLECAGAGDDAVLATLAGHDATRLLRRSSD